MVTLVVEMGCCPYCLGHYRVLISQIKYKKLSPPLLIFLFACDTSCGNILEGFVTVLRC